MKAGSQVKHKKKALTGCVLILASTACQTARPNMPSFLADTGIPTLTCDLGTFSTFMMESEPNDAALNPALVQWEDGRQRQFITPGSADDADRSWVVRLDVCVEDGSEPKAHLVRVVHFMAGATLDIFVPGASAIVTGLTESLFGDHSRLLIDLRPSTEIPIGFYAKGLADGNFAVASTMRIANGNYVPQYELVIAGRMTQGNHVNDGGCGGRTPIAWAFVLGSAKFTAKGCSFLGGGQTLGYQYHWFSIEDDNLALPANLRNRLFVFDSASAIEAVLEYNYTHHNDSDGFILTLPHATYIGQSRRNENNVEFKTRYGSGLEHAMTVAGCQQYYWCPLTVPDPLPVFH